MPTYDYHCTDCGNEFEHFQKMSEPVLETCPACKRTTLKRRIGTGAGMIFKGSGFYLTDYKNKSSASPSHESKTTEKSSDTTAPAAPADTKKETSAAKEPSSTKETNS